MMTKSEKWLMGGEIGLAAVLIAAIICWSVFDHKGISKAEAEKIAADAVAEAKKGQPEVEKVLREALDDYKKSLPAPVTTSDTASNPKLEPAATATLSKEDILERDKTREAIVLHDASTVPLKGGVDVYVPKLNIRWMSGEAAVENQRRLLELAEQEGRRQYCQTWAECKEQLLRAGLDMEGDEKRTAQLKKDKAEPKRQKKASENPVH